MIRLLSFIAVASFMIPSVSEAKNRPRTEQLRNLGQQMVETVLRGAELNPANRVKKKGCWQEDIDNLPNVYGTQSTFDEDNITEKKVYKVPFYKADNLSVVFKDLILAEDLKLHNGTSFKVDYNDSGDFVYEFYLKEGKDYLKCEKRDKNELFSHCKSFKKVANKNRATAFRVSGLLMDATEEDKKKGRVKKRSIAHIALLSDDLKTRLGVVHKKCFK